MESGLKQWTKQIITDHQVNKCIKSGQQSGKEQVIQ
jgi:hypothetical protein